MRRRSHERVRRIKSTENLSVTCITIRASEIENLKPSQATLHNRRGNVHMAQVVVDHTYCLLPFIPLVQPYIPNLKQETKLSC